MPLAAVGINMDWVVSTMKGMLPALWGGTGSVAGSGPSSRPYKSRYAHPSRARRRWRWMSSGSTAALLALAYTNAALPLVAGQHVVAAKFSDSEFVANASGLVLSTSEGGSEYMVRVEPMTSKVGLHQPVEDLEKVEVSGYLDLYLKDRRGTALGSFENSLAYINCDSASSRRNASSLFESAVSLRFKTIVFYSTQNDSYCQFRSPDVFSSVFTTVNSGKARALEEVLDRRVFQRTATIKYDESYVEQDSAGVEGQSATVAIALIVVISVAAAIGALFLYLLVSGAIRAHRNPDRYGPRAATMNGRPRQSRARGLARAVVDTLPVVRFNSAGAEQGNPIYENKPGEIEMEKPGGRFSRSYGGGRADHHVVAEFVHHRPEPLTVQEADIVTASATPSTNDAPLASTQLHCPVCQEDFERGQQLRVLPCGHSFHQTCIDPWLLNVSGSCPLCRIDLRPEDARRSFQMPPPPTTDVSMITQPRFIRYLEIYRSTASNSMERHQALRTLREERRGRSAVPELGFTRLRGYIKRKLETNGRNRDSNGSGTSQQNFPSEEDLQPPMSENELERQLSNTHR